MHDQAFTTLEYDSLRSLIRSFAHTPLGQARLANLTPLEDLEELRLALAAVADCVSLRQRGTVFSFSEGLDPAPALARLRVAEAPLDADAILQLARLCEQALAARAVILAERDLLPALWPIVSELPRSLNSVVAGISNKILPDGELDDRASPELARIRHEITRLRSQITRALESVMRKSGEAIQDELVTLRNDRFVIPVKSDHRGRVPGVAHGFSSSGATVFVEPMESIDSNNALQSLRETEEREVARILWELTEELRSELPGVEAAMHAVQELDFINGKTIFYEKFSCVIPEINVGNARLSPKTSATNSLELIEARHPLLEENLRVSGGSVVPISFSLPEKDTSMVISGANAGGKTVVLKTAGLLSLMALSGLPVPARAARVPFYSSVLADIGDHQSLAANLSTFTSHVANISRMIKLCTAPALVLLDEVGTGTDPEEGSALGVAVVDYFRRVCGAHVMATTHYSGLKMYAANEEGVLNASVEFDEQTLEPTYRLIVGIAGSSSGLEIARRFGIPSEIAAVASERVKDSSRQAAAYLRRIKKEAEEAVSLREALEEERAAVAEKFASLDKHAERRERERQFAFERALQKAIDLFEKRARELTSRIEDKAERLKVVREAERRTAELKREAQLAAANARTGHDRSTSIAGEQARRVRVMRDGQVIHDRGAISRHQLPDQQSAVEDETYVAVSELRDIAVGDRVRLRSFGSIGIVDQVKGDEAEVRVKSLRFREKLRNLELVETTAPKGEARRFASLRTPSGTEVHLKASEKNTRTELNVIGQSTDEAVDAVDKFLDEASLAGLSQLRIVHGHGTGALRRAISQLLQDHPHVARFSPAPPDHGGAGATIVELRT